VLSEIDFPRFFVGDAARSRAYTIDVAIKKNFRWLITVTGLAYPFYQQNNLNYGIKSN
jgi:hypothetical protein